MPYRITFVCTGNICRSPMAEHVLRRRAEEAGLDVVVDSSGTGGWHIGDPADHRTVRTLRRHDYTSAHSARKFQRSWFDDYDLIIALDRGHERELRRQARTAQDTAKIRLLRSFDPQAGEDLDVPDPYYGGDADFEHVLELIEAAVPGLLAEAALAAKTEA
jgi:protein-tyrosine phosphatase